MINQIYHKTYSDKNESVQYNVALAALTVKGPPQTKLNNEPSLDTICFCRSFRCLCTFYKIRTQGLPNNFCELIQSRVISGKACSFDQVQTYHCGTNIYNYYFSIMQFASGTSLIFNHATQKLTRSLEKLYLRLGFQYSVLHMKFINSLEVKSDEHFALP